MLNIGVFVFDFISKLFIGYEPSNKNVAVLFMGLIIWIERVRICRFSFTGLWDR